MTIIKNRRGTTSQWTTANPILAEGEIGVETDTGKHKIGNGVSAWLGLHYFVDESGLSASTALGPTGSITYNTDGTVHTDQLGGVWAYNTDGTVHTYTLGGTTRTYTYNSDGTIASVA